MGTTETTHGANGALVQREEFGATQLQTVRETAATAVAAREKAAVEARYIMALQRPRSLERARQQLLDACKHKDFAEASWFVIPNRGEGFTIRFAEEALRCVGNIYPEVMIVYENDEIRMFRVTVTDLETNLSYSTETIVQKTVERKQLKKGQVAVRERLNSYGDKVYLIEATEEETLVKQNAALSKAIRTNGLRLIPAWIKEEAKRAIFTTLENDVKEDFVAKRRKAIDAFVQLGITVQHLEQYFGKPIEQTTPSEITTLKPIYTALKDGETTWDQVMEGREAELGSRGGSKEAAQHVAEEKLRKQAEETAAKEGVDASAKETSAEAVSETPEPSGKGKMRGFDFGGARK